MVRQAVILAGGLGTRLGERSIGIPKPMQPVGGRPMLEYLLWNLKRHGVTDIVLSVGHLSDVIVDHFGDGKRFGLSIRYVQEDSPAGTGGALALCAPLLQERFLFLNGDTMFDFNVLDLALSAARSAALGCLALRKVDDVSRYGEVVLDGLTVSRFAEKPPPQPGLISGGVALLKRQIVNRIPAAACSLEKDVFTPLAEAGLLAGKAYDGFFIDIGLPETLDDAQISVPAWQRKPALLLDRDGVLNINHGYVCSPDRFEWTRGAVAAVKAANDAGLLVLVLTNQAGISRGYYTELQFQAFMAWINDQLRAEGAHLDGWYHCPHHPTEGLGDLKTDCDCRKPKPGMVRQAIADWQLDPQRCLLLGDKRADLQAGEACGVAGALFDPAHDDLLETVHHFVLPRLLAATKHSNSYF